VFTRNGIIDKIVQVESEELADICQTAYGLNWIIAAALFLVQVASSFLIAQFYGNNALIIPICIIAATYLVYPLSLVQTALIRRENRLNIIALTTMYMVTADNILTGLFALLGWGMWAIVLPKLLVAPIHVFMGYKNHSWRMEGPLTLKNWQKISSFSGKILGIEMLTTFRENIDYLLIGRFLGVKALGIYYFAFNAGLGISLSVINAIRTSLYSDLCDVRSNGSYFRQRFFKSLRTIATIIIPLVILQSSLAPIYVPIVFGHQWIERGAIPILILICLSALSRPFADASSLMFRAFGFPGLELRWNLLFTAFLASAIGLGTHWGIQGAAIAVCATHLVLQPLYTVWSSRYVLSRLNIGASS
ncbi:MAG: oligosaccharide flippase family protein, partial [Thermosynechococcaceae cyanobacterium]